MIHDKDPEVGPVRPGEHLDWHRLGRWLREQHGHTGQMTVRQFLHGSANLTYLVTVDDRPLVVRRAPFGQLTPGAHDMAREYRVLAGLAGHYDRAPTAIAFCDDPSVIGAPFLISEYRPGLVVRSDLPSSMTHVPDVGRLLGFAVVDALVDLQTVDPTAAGLDTLGRPAGYVTRQVDGWLRRWSAVAGPGETGHRMDVVAYRLRTTIPNSPTDVVIVHNDLKLNNCQFAPERPERVQSVFDWDMATLGDPLVDLGILLGYWPDPDDGPDDQPLAHDAVRQLGLPARAHLVDRYARATGRDVTRIGWYEAFATWKAAVVMQQLYARWQRGESTDERMTAMGALVPALARRADQLLSRDRATAG